MIKHVVSDMSLRLCHRKTLVHNVVQCILKTPLDPTVTVYQVKHVDKVSLLECDNMESFYGVTASYREYIYDIQRVGFRNSTHGQTET